jgi:heterodisulfide reductase subunit A-like polyferredoxin
MAVDEEATEDLAMIFHLNRTLDGCFLEEHVKLRPTDLSVPGFFVAGSVHAPKNIKECIAQAQAAASRVLAMLSKDTINLGATVARVDPEKCATCLACVRACPTGSPLSMKIATPRLIRPSVMAAVSARPSARPRRSSLPGLRMRRSWRVSKDCLKGVPDGTV